MHNVKLVELVAMKKYDEKTYLHIKLSSEYESEFFWLIDNATAINLFNIFECDGNHKYRLSLNSSYNNGREQFESSITKTYRDISQPILFDCSVEYNNCLQSIKNTQSMTDLIDLPFIFKNLPYIKEITLRTKNKKGKVGNKKHLARTFSWLVALVSIILIIFTLSIQQSVNKNLLDHTVVIAAQPITTVTPVNSTANKNIILPVTLTLGSESTQTSHPFITTDEYLTYSIPEGYVALTFDDGPSKHTVAITDILMEYNVGGTFFFLGKNAKKYPESVRYVQSNGYAIGNHSMNHSNMTKLTIEEQEEELLQSANIIEDITNEKLVLFRPPYGALNQQVTDLALAHLYKIVQWNSDPEDWKTRDPEKIINYVRENKASGSIIILHETQAVVDALPKIIEILQEQNLTIVNLQ